MIAEIGQFLLILALFVAGLQMTLPLLGILKKNEVLIDFGIKAALLQAGLLISAFLALITVFLRSDFSVALVVAHSHSKQPFFYKLAASWGNHEGSLLLWVLILAVFGASMAIFIRLSKVRLARILAVQGGLGFGFLAFLIFTSNPFLRLIDAPLEGQMLNPLLQDFALVLHPPLLYLGYVGFASAFSFAVAGLMGGDIDRDWAKNLRPWLLFAWTSLTAGIALGSWWSYYELGWGGWWAWDPVENSSLLPWLCGTALLHSVIILEKREGLTHWVALLSLFTFMFSMLGTFLVRSGILTSVHVFALDPERGLFILGLICFYGFLGFGLYMWRTKNLPQSEGFSIFSRGGMIILNNLFLLTICATILTGTLYPLFLQNITGAEIGVGAPYFNLTVIPLSIPIAFLMVIAPMISWQGGNIFRAIKRLLPVMILVIIAIMSMFILMEDKPLLAIFGMAMGIWISLASLIEFAFRVKIFHHSRFKRLSKISLGSWAMILAHFGIGVSIIGMAGMGGFSEETALLVNEGELVHLGEYSLLYHEGEAYQGANYIAERADIEVRRDLDYVTRIEPERRLYGANSQITTEASYAMVGFGDDIYAAIGEKRGDDNGRVLRLYLHRLVAWLWFGAGLMVLGGVFATIRAFKGLNLR